MFRLFSIIIMCLCGLACTGQVADYAELELTSVHSLANYPHRFDFSGMVKINDQYLAVADKSWNQYVYHMEIDSNYWYLTDSLALGLTNNSDLEGIDFCEKSGMYFIDEKFNRAYLLQGDGTSKVIFNKGQLRGGYKWGSNSGLEGLAVDCEHSILYLAKERDPRFIVSYDLDQESIIDIFNLPASEGDISDLKFENGFLYVLERKDNYITKMNATTKQIVAKVSYKDTCSHPAGKLYKHSEYGLAEALLLTPEEIWLGLDNNGLPFSDHAVATYGLSGNQPLLLKFKRPPGF